MKQTSFFWILQSFAKEWLLTYCSTTKGVFAAFYIVIWSTHRQGMFSSKEEQIGKLGSSKQWANIPRAHFEHQQLSFGPYTVPAVVISLFESILFPTGSLFFNTFKIPSEFPVYIHYFVFFLISWRLKQLKFQVTLNAPCCNLNPTRQEGCHRKTNSP